MIHREKVHCGLRDVPALEIGVDTVYVRYNIHQVKTHNDRDEMEYTEDSYSIKEYLDIEVAKEEPDIEIIRELVSKLKKGEQMNA